jgi:hypothetical protein
MDEDEMLVRLVALFVASISFAGVEMGRSERHKAIIRDAEKYVKWLEEQS